MSKDCHARSVTQDREVATPHAPVPALITGASGFIGRALAQHLHANGAVLTCLLRRPPAVPLPGAQLLCADFSDEPQLQAQLHRAAPEIVFHLAGSTAPVYPQTFDTELRATEALLRAAAAMERPPRIILIGSAAEYGPLTTAALPAGEHTPCAPVTPYGAAKLAQTRMALAAAAAGVPVVVARLFNIIGPGMGPHLAMGRFARALAALPSTGGVLRTGHLGALRDVVALDDAVRVLSELAAHPHVVGRVVPVCTGHAVRMDELVQMLIDACGMDVRIEIEHAQRGVSSVDVMLGDTSCLQALGIAVPRADLGACIEALWTAQRLDSPASASAVADANAVAPAFAGCVASAPGARLKMQPTDAGIHARRSAPTAAAGD